MIRKQTNDEPGEGQLQFRITGNEAYRTALGAIQDRYASTLDRLRSMRADEIALVASPWDDMISLFDIIGVPFSVPAQLNFISNPVKILVAGCPLRESILSPFDILQVLNNGGIIISSDKAAAWMPVLSDLLRTETPRGPARSRVVFTDSDLTAVQDGSLLPVAWLDSGHIPLSSRNASQGEFHISATNALTGEPLAIVVEFGGGCFVHAVPHWWQPALGQTETALEARSVVDVPGFSGSVPSDSRLTVGEYVSAKAMLILLLSGIEYAFAQMSLSMQSEKTDSSHFYSED